MNSVLSEIDEVPKAAGDFENRVGLRHAVAWVVAGVAAFHLAIAHASLSPLILVYALALLEMARVPSRRMAFRCGFFLGLLTFAPHLLWFWSIFGVASAGLWAVLSFFTGLFLALAHSWKQRFGALHLWIAAPVFWTALEYFRGELYFLRFSWLGIGTAFSERMGILPIGWFGSYGMGFAIFLLAGGLVVLSEKRRLVGLIISLAYLGISVHWRGPVPESSDSDLKTVKVAGIQLEFPPELQIPEYLDRVLEKHPDAEILVLSEYTLEAGVPARVRDWCRERKRYLIVGGKDDSPGHGDFYNTAFVVGPSGEIVFQQVKSVPIQFFKDGLPAPAQNVWDSPWGRIALCVCYDLSYRRVMDRFAVQGAQAFIVPFMDLIDWGEHQHELHARIGPLRAREYGIPIFRLGSSGVSQDIDRTGTVRAEAPYPGQEQMLAGTLEFRGAARLPLDVWLAPLCVALTAAYILWRLGSGLTERVARASKH